MVWLFVIVVLALAVAFKGFRVFLLGVLGLAALAFWFFAAQQDEEREAERTRVPVTDVHIEDAMLGTYMTGRVRNNNRTYRVTGLDVKVTVRDCVAPADEKKKAGRFEILRTCDVVGQSDKLINVSVPPGQVRDVRELVWFSPEPVYRGQMEWDYTITAVRARKD